MLAAAGLIRINLAHRITAFLSSPVLLYSVGQGSLGVEVRTPPPGATPETNRDARILEVVRSIGDWRSTARAEAERGLLRELEGGCSIPVGVESSFEDHEEIEGKRIESVVPLAADAELGESGKEGHTITKAAVEATGSVVTNGATSGTVSGIGLGFKATALRNPSISMEVASSAAAADAAAPSGAGSRPSMERYATGAIEKPQHGSPGTNGTGSGNLEHLATGNNTPSLSDSYFPSLDPESILSLLKPPSFYHKSTSAPPASPLELSLTAIVVSLDGTRSSSSTLTRSIQTLEEARELGVTVARELRDERGAREILREVEVHRQRAEAADEERRRARKRKVEEENARAKAAYEASHQAGEEDQESGGGGKVFAADPQGAGTDTGAAQQTSRRKLEEVLGAVTRQRDEQQARDAKALYPQEGGEMDRRGVPREDGQEKVWEV